MSTDAQRAPLLSITERRGMVRDALAVLSSSYVAAVCGVLQNLIVLSVIPPLLTGIWTAIRTVLDYSSYSSLGINRAAAIEIAVESGRADQSKRSRIANMAMTIELGTATLVATALFTGAAIYWLRGEFAWAIALCAGGALAVVSRYHAFCLAVLRSTKNFPTLARSRIFGAIIELLFFSVGAWLYGFHGMLAAAVLSQLINAIYVTSNGGLRFRADWDASTLRRQLLVGGPLAGEALALAALRTIDRVVIVLCLTNGEEQLGWYKIAIVMGAWAFDQSNLIANVVFPRLGETLGRTNDPASVLRIALRAAEISCLAMIVCSAALLAAGAPLVAWWLPNYRPGLIGAAGLVTAAVFLGVSMPLRHALLTVGRTRSMLMVTALAAGLSWTGGLWALSGSPDRTGAALEVVSWISAAAAATLLAATLALCVHGQSDYLKSAGRIAGLCLYALAGIGALHMLRVSPAVCFVAACLWIVLPCYMLAQIVDWRGLLAPNSRAPHLGITSSSVRSAIDSTDEVGRT